MWLQRRESVCKMLPRLSLPPPNAKGTDKVSTYWVLNHYQCAWFCAFLLGLQLYAAQRACMSLIHAHTQADRHTCMYTHLRTCTHALTHTHTRTHTHTHTPQWNCCPQMVWESWQPVCSHRTGWILETTLIGAMYIVHNTQYVCMHTSQSLPHPSHYQTP